MPEIKTLATVLERLGKAAFRLEFLRAFGDKS